MTSEARSQGGETCLGTREVEIVVRGNNVGQPTAALMAAFLRVDEVSDQKILQVLLTEGTRTFKGKVHPNQTKVHWKKHQSSAVGGALADNDGLDEASKVKILASYLLSDHNQQISFTYDMMPGNGGSASVKLVMRERLATGLVLILFSITLQAENGNMSFCSILGKCINTQHQEIDSLKKQREDLLQWKDTAEKLDGAWQQEKDSLLDRFLTLYRKTQLELKKALGQVDALKRNPNKQSISDKKKKGGRDTFAYEGGRDVEMFDAETVERFARGERQKFPEKGGANGRDAFNVASTRKNPHTGALEVWDIDKLLGTGHDVSADQMTTDVAMATVPPKKDGSKNHTGDETGSGHSQKRMRFYDV